TVQVFIHFMAILLPYLCHPPKPLQHIERQKLCQPLRSPAPVGHTRGCRALRGGMPRVREETLCFCQNERGVCNALNMRAAAEAVPERLGSVGKSPPAGMNFAC